MFFNYKQAFFNFNDAALLSALLHVGWGTFPFPIPLKMNKGGFSFLGHQSSPGEVEHQEPKKSQMQQQIPDSQIRYSVAGLGQQVPYLPVYNVHPYM